MLLDGPELREPELGAMRRRGVRRHAQLGHEPRDGHVLLVQEPVVVRWASPLTRARMAHGIPPRSRAWVHVPRRRRVQSSHRLVGYLAGHGHEVHVLWRRRVQSSHRLVGYLAGHEHGANVPRRRVQSSHRLVGYLQGLDMGSMFNSATAWQARYTNCGSGSSHSACSEFTSFSSSAGSTDGPPAAGFAKTTLAMHPPPPLNGDFGNCTDTLWSRGSPIFSLVDIGSSISSTAWGARQDHLRALQCDGVGCSTRATTASRW